MKLLLTSIVLLITFSNLSLGFEGTGSVVTGIAFQAECDSRKMIGHVEIRNVKDGVMTSEWFKVRSKELCERSVENLMFFGSTSPLLALSSDNINALGHNEGGKFISTFKLENGIITGIIPEKTKRMSEEEFNSVTEFEQLNTNYKVLNWYFEQKFQ